jgi:hypothetical protein
VLVETHPDKPVLIVNPTSGGGAASRYDLVGQCRARGIEPVMFERGDDLSALGAAAVEGGADVIGMAAGDGSQAARAAVAAEHDVPYVCVPAGTRNHFRDRHRRRSRRRGRRAGRVRRRSGAADRLGAGQRSELREHRVDGLVRRDRAVPGLSRRDVANADRDAARPPRTRFGGIQPAAGDPVYGRWFSEHDATAALQRPDFHLYGTAASPAAAAALLDDLRTRLEIQPSREGAIL